MEDELEVIVQKMIDAGESEENIATVVKNYSKEDSTPKEVQPKVEATDSASTLGQESTSLESDQNKPTKPSSDTNVLEDVMFDTKYPDLASERDELNKVVQGRGIMADNSAELKRLEEIEAYRQESSKPKESMRSVYKNQLNDIDAEMFELEKKADMLSKNNDFSFEEILDSDGSYQTLKKERQQVMGFKAPYEKVLEKIKEDTNSSTGTKDLFQNAARLFGYKESSEQTVKLSEDVEEQILKDLGDDKIKLGKIEGGYASLDEKEDIISNAKSKVINAKYDKLLKDQEEVLNSDLEKVEKDEALQKLGEDFDFLLGSVGYDTADNILKNTFRKSDVKDDFNESIVKGGFLPSIVTPLSTLVDETGKLILDSTVGFVGSSMAMVGDLFQSQNHYSVYDAFGDTIDQFTDQVFTPNTESEKFRLRQDDGELEVTPQALINDVSRSIPFTLAIINEARKGNMSGIESKLGKFINPSKSEAFSKQLVMMETAYKLSLSSSFEEAKTLGLDGASAAAYSNTLALVEGITEPLMDDTKFFKTIAGDAVLKAFKGDLRKAATKEVISQSVKRFVKNVASEIGEEEIVMGVTDLAKYALVVGHENSEFWDINNQAELALIAGTMSGGFSSLSMRGNIKADRASIYRDISNNINGVSENLQNAKANSTDEKFIEEVDKTMEWANNMNAVIKKAPQNVTSQQIDLLMEKKELIEEMKSVDDAFHPQYKEKIDAINAKINPVHAKEAKENSKQEPSNGTTKDGTEEVDEQGVPKAENKEVEKTFQEFYEENYDEVYELVGGKTSELSKAMESKALDSGIKIQEDLLSKNFSGYNTQMVDISELDNFKGEDRLGVDEQPNSRKKIDELKVKIKEEGLKEPLVMFVEGNEASIVEGNHRLVALKELGYKYVPVSVNKGDKIPKRLNRDFLPVDSKSKFSESAKDLGFNAYNLDKFQRGANTSISELDKVDLSSKLGIDKAISVIDNLDKQLKDFSDSTLGVNIPVAVARVALKGMKAAAQGSKLAADIVSAGVNEVTKTDWYRNLTKAQKSDFHKRGLMGQLQDLETTLRKGSQPNKASKPFVKKVKKVTGQTDPSKKITTTEAKQLKLRFKNLEKGSKLGAKAVMQAKADFIKEVSKALRTMENSKSITRQEATRILSAVNQMNDKNYDKVKPLVDKLVQKMESKGLDSKIKSTKKVVKRASKSKRTPLNIRELAKGASIIDQKYLSESSNKKYLKALESISKALKASTNSQYEMANQEKLENTLNELIDEAEKGRVQSVVESMGMDGSTLTNKEMEELLLAENVDEFIGNLKEAKAKAARLALEKQASYAAIALSDVDMTSMSEKEKRYVRELKKADLTLLSSTDIRDFIKVVDNIALNDNFSSSYDIVSKVRSYRNMNEALNVFNKNELGFLRDSVVTNFKTLSLMFKTVFKNGQKSAKFNRLSGLSDLSIGYTKARKSVDALGKEYDNLIKEVAKKYNKKIRRSENTMLRGVVSQLIQGSTSEDFEINKSRLEDHLKNLKKSGGVAINRYAQNLQETYDQFKDFKSQDEVIEYTKNRKDGNWELVEFWLDYFANTKDALKYNTEVVHGEKFDEVTSNYLPIKMKQDGSALPKDDSEKAFYNLNGIMGTKASPTTIKRTKTKKLPQGRILDLDFDSVMFNRANRVEIDINTSAQHKDVVNFFKSPAMYDLFHKEVVDAFIAKVNSMRDVQLGVSNISNNDALMKTASRVERGLKTLGTTMALGSVTQYPKQYVSVAVNVMARLGTNSGLMLEAMFTKKGDFEIVNMASVSMRGDTQAGTISSATRITEEQKRATVKMASHLARATGEKMATVRDLLFTSLRKGDVNVAKASWIAFYKEYLIKNGVDKADINMNTEHTLLESDVRRQDALSYAELMVEETQISSDDSRGSEFYQSTDTWKSLFRGIFLPYQSFNINSKMRMLTDFSIIQNTNNVNSKEEKAEAWKSLAGTTAEVVAFQAMKIYVLSQVYALGKVAVEELFGLEAPEEDEESDSDFKFKKFYSSLIKDLNPLSIGAFAEDMSIEVLNLIHYLASREDSDQDLYDFQKELRKESGGNMFYKYGDELGFEWNVLNDGGLYQIPSKQLQETVEDYHLAFNGEKRDSYGNKAEYEFEDGQEEFMKFAFIVDLISTLGLGEADSRRIINSVKREQVKQAKKKKK